MTLAEKLVRIRAELNLSQEALARELGVSFATINRWERGHTNPSARYIYIIDRYGKEKNITLDE